MTGDNSQEIRRQAGIKSGDPLLMRVEALGVAELNPVHCLTIDELASRYSIDGPINEPADRKVWKAEAARDVIGQQKLTMINLIDTNTLLHLRTSNRRTEQRLYPEPGP
jgi:hypothetical protein